MKTAHQIQSTQDLESLVREQLFDIVPFGVAVIDPEMNVITANRNFEEYFGQWKNRRCYEVCKGLEKRCPQCDAIRTFKDGQSRVSDETGIDRHGRTCHYVVHVAPLLNEDGKVQYVVEMTTDMTETRIRQREYNLLFERVPCFITIIDRDYKIVRANEKFRKTFGAYLIARAAGGRAYLSRELLKETSILGTLLSSSMSRSRLREEDLRQVEAYLPQ